MRRFSTLDVLLIAILASGIHTAWAGEEPQTEAPVKPIVSDFSFSGYANITANAPSGNKMTLSADDLSLFGNGHINQKFNPFFEAEIAQLILLRQGGDPLASGSPHLILERLYNDSYLTNKLSLRVGKMLSPVGEWNMIHAAPLVLTTTRPDVTYYGFSEFSSGVSLIYADAHGMLPEIQAYWQPGKEIRPRPWDMITREYEHVSGFHLNWPSGLNDILGISVQHAQVKNTNVQQTLTGFNFSKEIGSLTIESEAIHTHIVGVDASQPRVRDNESGAYLQGAYQLDENLNLNLIGRYEYFAERRYINPSRNALLGVCYKSISSSVWKLEYIKQTGQLLDIPTGVFASFSRLF